ncbi:MAG: hypothetical protein M5U28_12500 [Sandaracinaceae bacterium]|nr:hypothetical protein [Sandaracinaceae bacterium]
MILGEPNFFAYAALFLWVPVALAAFSLLRPPLAAMVTLLGGVMFLPESVAVDPPSCPHGQVLHDRPPRRSWAACGRRRSACAPRARSEASTRSSWWSSAAP